MVVVVAVTMVRGDECEKLKPWRFLGQISERGRSFSVCAVGFFFFFGWLGVTVVVGGGGGGCGHGLSVMSFKSSGHGGFESKYQREGEALLG